MGDCSRYEVIKHGSCMNDCAQVIDDDELNIICRYGHCSVGGRGALHASC